MDNQLDEELEGAEKRLRDSRKRATSDPAQLPEHADNLLQAARVCRRAGRHEQATALLTEAVAAYQQLRDLPGELRALSDISVVLRAEERFAEAADVCRQMLAIATGLGWEKVQDTLQYRIVAMEAADRAGIDVPDLLVATALADGKPGQESWVYEIDEELHRRLGTKDHVPAEAIIRGRNAAALLALRSIS